MTKTLAERAEEARIELELKVQEYIECARKACREMAMEQFRQTLPEAVYREDLDKFQLGGELFSCKNYGTTTMDDGTMKLTWSLTYPDCYYRFFSDMAGYGEYLKYKNEIQCRQPVEEKMSWWREFFNFQ